MTEATASLAALYSQKLHMGNGQYPLARRWYTNHKHELAQTIAVSGVNCGDECQCYVEGKCKPCSWFEMGRQVPDCLLTGYHQWAYCPQHKKRKYVR